MPYDLGPWLAYQPEQTQHAPEERSRKGRRIITPPDAAPFFVYGEYDDGNGMWMITGVSPCG